MTDTSTSINVGEARWWLGGIAVIKATSASTGGQLAIIEVTEPAGMEAPLHVHHNEDEGFFVLEGSVTIYVDDESTDARAGDFAWGPRDVPHRYTVGPDGCRMLFVCTPGGFEKLVREMSEPGGSLTVPPPPDEEPDWDRVARVATENGCELLT